MANTKTEQRTHLRQNEEKWTPRLMEAGWTALPSIILEKQHALGLDAVDVNILLHLARHWWYRDNPPRPSKASIAECLGVDRSTVRRHIAAMEKAGLIRREARYRPSGGQENNAYHFDGLIKEATPFAEEAIRERERQQSERTERRHRKSHVWKSKINRQTAGDEVEPACEPDLGIRTRGDHWDHRNLPCAP